MIMRPSPLPGEATARAGDSFLSQATAAREDTVVADDRRYRAHASQSAAWAALWDALLAEAPPVDEARRPDGFGGSTSSGGAPP